MSALIRDPLGRQGARPLGSAAEGGWPADPNHLPAHAARRAPIGAEWDPLCEPWPAVCPQPVAPPAPEPATPQPVDFLGGQGAGFAPQVSARLTGARLDALPALAYALPPEPRPVRDYSPSRLSYRMNRLWLTPSVRRFVRQGLPLLLLLGTLAGFWAGEGRRAMVLGILSDIRAAVEARPEFRIDYVEVLTDTPEVARAVLERLEVELPASSLRLDLNELRARAEALDAVAQAAVQVRTGGVLELRLTERRPAMIWRHAGGLDLIDAEGRRVARIAARAVRPDLPLIAGEGASAAIAEAHSLLAAAEPVQDRIQGLQRVGERRWDLVLDRDQRILLPAGDPVVALERVMALDAAHDLLSRDILAVDMRNPLRPTLRLSPEASTELARIRQLDTRVANR